MELIYASEKLKSQCKNKKDAKKLFAGNEQLTVSLLARINALENAETLMDIVVQKTFRFHNLENKYGRNLKGYFAIDVKTKKEPWRIILQPLDDDENIFDPCYIDQIAGKVKIVEISEVSKHYE